MNLRFRYALFATALAGFAALLVWGTAGIPAFGHYRGRYGRILSRAAVPERQTTNAVTAIVFDYRGLDTMGEEFILFAAVTGVALLLRDERERTPDLLDPVESDAVRSSGVCLAAGVLVLGLWIVAHGAVTPGGGFQGGVVLASAFLLLWLAGSLRDYRRMTPTPMVDFVEGTGAGGYAVIGTVALFLGEPFLHNMLPHGLAGKLSSGGSIPVLNWATGLAVTAAFLLLFSEFLDEHALALRGGRRG
jgi:multicomponent Na+:H+ antiporter subunit B